MADHNSRSTIMDNNLRESCRELLEAAVAQRNASAKGVDASPRTSWRILTSRGDEAIASGSEPIIIGAESPELQFLDAESTTLIVPRPLNPDSTASTTPQSSHTDCYDSMIKFRFAKQQHSILEARFQHHNKPGMAAKKELANTLGVSINKVNNWFQNRRAKEKQDSKPKSHDNLNDAVLRSPLERAESDSPSVASSPEEECPTLTFTSNSTVSSRNSSTRSTRLYDDDCAGRCPLSSCNRIFKDLKAHMLTHQVHIEKCPVATCVFHKKGFVNPYDKMRHVSLHFEGTLTCGFCGEGGICAERRYTSDSFIRHLRRLHGVELICLGQAEELYNTGTIKRVRNPIEGQPIAACSLCSEPFDPQGLYEHLLGCILRQVTDIATRNSGQRNNKQVAKQGESTADPPRNFTLDGDSHKKTSNPIDPSFSHGSPHYESVRTHAPKPDDVQISGHLECFVCKETFTSDTRWRRHLRIHTIRERYLASTQATNSDRKDDNQLYMEASAPFYQQSEYNIGNTHLTKNGMLLARTTNANGSTLQSPRLGNLYAIETADSQGEEADIAEITASSRCLSLTSSNGIRNSDEETDWTEDAGASSPQSDTDAIGVQPVLSPVKQQLVDSIMKEFHRLFNQRLASHLSQLLPPVQTCHGGGGTSGSSSAYSYSSSLDSNSINSSSISRKRSLSGGGSRQPRDNRDNGDDPNKRRKPDFKTHSRVGSLELRFACPYYKRNPGRHQTFTSCRDPGFNTVARLKEHLYRRHLLPIQCNRCCSIFPNEPSLREHQRDPRGCEVREQVPLEGFDKDQERKLKSKKRAQVSLSEEEKWNSVYRILFPDDDETDMPSPYIEYHPQGLSTTPSETSNVARFQEFSRLELPRLVRRTLEVVVEQEAQPLEEKLKERLVDIVKECQIQLVSMFQGTEGPGNTETSLATMNTANPSSFSQGPVTSIDPAFPDFDSLLSIAPTLYSTTATKLSHTTSSSANLQHTDCPLIESTSASDSPDSGYDSNFSYIPSIQQNTSLDPNFPLNGSDYVDMNGYFNMLEDHTLPNGAWQFSPSGDFTDAFRQSQ